MVIWEVATAPGSFLDTNGFAKRLTSPKTVFFIAH